MILLENKALKGRKPKYRNLIAAALTGLFISWFYICYVGRCPALMRIAPLGRF
jgi:hypothetical protein